MREKVVLAYSGGLDTSVAIKWLEENYGCDVVTVTVDIGQREDLSEVARRAEAIGSVKHYSVDAKEEFVKDYIFPAIRANALYEEKYPLSTALGRPLLAKKVVEVAEREGAFAVAHGCTGKGNDQVRFDTTIKALDPSLKIIAPVREWNLSRDEEIRYAREHGIPMEPKRSIYSVDQNIWGRSIESGPLEDPAKEPPPDVFEWVSPPEDMPDNPGYLEIGFEDGVPVSLNGERMPPVSLIESVNKFSGKHGVGVIDHMEDRLVGIKSREVYECPAAITIIEAHKDLEKLVLTRHELQFKKLVEQEWAWLVYSGLWVEPLREELDAFIDASQEVVEGEVKLRLFKGSLRTVARSSPYSLYDLRLATYEGVSGFDQRSSAGFIELWSLPTRIAHLAKKRSKISARISQQLSARR